MFSSFLCFSCVCYFAEGVKDLLVCLSTIKIIKTGLYKIRFFHLFTLKMSHFTINDSTSTSSSGLNHGVDLFRTGHPTDVSTCHPQSVWSFWSFLFPCPISVEPRKSLDIRQVFPVSIPLFLSPLSPSNYTSLSVPVVYTKESHTFAFKAEFNHTWFLFV